jgi:tRNA(Ile)-lysidine synthase
VTIARPLLGIAKARLRATLEARGIPWCEDPSNELCLFERTRLRAAREALEALGLTSDMLALSARRLRRARAALEAATEQAWTGPEALVRADACGVLTLDRDRLRRLPEEIAVRLVGGCVAAAGGLQKQPPLGRLEPIVAGLRQGAEGGGTGHWTLARALVTAAHATIRIEREPGRQPLPTISVAGGGRALWDGRFAVAVAEGCSASFEVRALGAGGVRQLRDLGLVLEAARPLRLVPSFWQGDRLLAVPAIGFWASGELKGRLSADFLGLRSNREAPGGPVIEDSEGF